MSEQARSPRHRPAPTHTSAPGGREADRPLSGCPVPPKAEMQAAESEEESSPLQLSDDKQEEAARRTALPADVVYQAICNEGENELARSSAALAWSGLAAGLSMGFSLVAEGLLTVHLPEAPWRPLITKLGYSVGFLMVVLGRQQL